MPSIQPNTTSWPNWLWTRRNTRWNRTARFLRLRSLWQNDGLRANAVHWLSINITSFIDVGGSGIDLTIPSAILIANKVPASSLSPQSRLLILLRLAATRLSRRPSAARLTMWQTVPKARMPPSLDTMRFSSLCPVSYHDLGVGFRCVLTIISSCRNSITLRYTSESVWNSSSHFEVILQASE